MKLFYSNKSNYDLIGYANAGYLRDPYLFTYEVTTISWRSIKQTITTTSSNLTEILAIHKAKRACVWLGSMTHHIRERYGLSFSESLPTILS